MNVRHVAVILESVAGCYQQTLVGVSAFALARPAWQIQRFAPRSSYLNALAESRPDGLLVGPMVYGEKLNGLMNLGVPAVSLYSGRVATSPCRMSTVRCDDVQVGRVAARHFLDRAFRRFGYLGHDIGWADFRRAGFAAELAEHGLQVDELVRSRPLANDHGETNRLEVEAVRAWISGLGQRVGILACNDRTCRGLAQICQNLGVAVPEQVALLGVDDDEVECELGAPSLSSVSLPWRKVGFEAARLLDAMIEDGAAADGEAPTDLVLAPDRVVVRRSTDITAVDDEELGQALGFIQDNAHRPISVSDVLRAVPISRRRFEIRCRETLGRTPLEEIRRVHVERAKMLLSRTTLAMPEVAQASGFANAVHFSRVFREEVGQVPTAYRRGTEASVPR